jgi:hypothetical protein
LVSSLDKGFDGFVGELSQLEIGFGLVVVVNSATHRLLTVPNVGTRNKIEAAM